jgi:hypothetical protein
MHAESFHTDMSTFNTGEFSFPTGKPIYRQVHAGPSLELHVPSHGIFYPDCNPCMVDANRFHGAYRNQCVLP